MTNHVYPDRMIRAALLAVAPLFLIACGKGDGDKKPATQVAAKVGKEEISVHQINNVLERTRQPLTPEQSKAASRQILEGLIDQELLVQQAAEKKLDRDPKVMQSIEAAKRELLARAYLDQVLSAAPPPTADEAKEFYGKHPELFSERRIYSINELILQPTPDQAQKLSEVIGKAKSISEVVEWLKAENIRYNANTVTRPAESIPLEVLPQFHKMKDGQIAVIRSQNTLSIVQLAASRSQPLNEQAAKPLIDQYLLSQKRTKLRADELKRLREATKVEYTGEFTAPSAPAAAAPAQAGGASTPPSGDGSNKLDSSIEKGLSGIK